MDKPQICLIKVFLGGCLIKVFLGGCLIKVFLGGLAGKLSKSGKVTISSPSRPISMVHFNQHGAKPFQNVTRSLNASKVTTIVMLQHAFVLAITIL